MTDEQRSARLGRNEAFFREVNERVRELNEGFAEITDTFEIVFDTIGASRKGQNLRVNRRVALVLGNSQDGDEWTVQYEGLADEPAGRELERLKNLYFAVFPDGRDRERWPGLTYFRVTPTWVRYSNYNVNPPAIVEFEVGDLTASP